MRTPIFTLAEAITDTTTAALPPGLAPLTINGVESPITPHPRWFYSDLLPFEGALLDAYALRVITRLNVGDNRQAVDVYQGEAARFGGYLRSVARWQTSAPKALGSAMCNSKLAILKTSNGADRSMRSSDA